MQRDYKQKITIREMERGRFILIHNNKDIYRFNWLTQAQRFAIAHCRRAYEFYAIIDTQEDKVVSRWCY